jgi:regulator of nucleoside diphosphate kinase
MKTASSVCSRKDRWRLGLLLDSDEARALARQSLMDQLRLRLEEATAVAPESIADDVVTMNSTVRLRDTITGEYITRTLVYPDKVDLVDEPTSVLDPLGSALIGCRVGDVVTCTRKQDCPKLEIVEVAYQPERAGELTR